MKKGTLTSMFSRLDGFTKKNSPAILAGCAVVGVITTVYCAWKAAPRADDILKKHRKEMDSVKKGDKEARRAVTKETVKEMVPVVAPTALMAGSTVACIIGSQRLNGKRIAALSAAYAMSKDMVNDLNEQMIKDLGPKKAQAVKDAVFEKKVTEEHPEGTPVRDEIMRKKGMYWCRDYYTGCTFQTNAFIINQAITDISARVGGEMYITLGEFWQSLQDAGSSGMESMFRTPVKDQFCWTADDLKNGRLDISYTSVLDEDDSPILALDYDPRPYFNSKIYK